MESIMISAADKIHNMRTSVEEYFNDHKRFIKDFKGEDEFNRLLQIQWEKSLKKDGHTKYALAPIMIEEGHVEAFPVALQGIMDDDICSWHTDEILEAIMHKIPGVDSKKSYSDWYGENKNRIKYNKESGNFEVR